MQEVRDAAVLIATNPLLGPRVEGTDLRVHVTHRYKVRVFYSVVGSILEVREIFFRGQDGRK